jgi:hypothetical protein
MFSPEKFFHNLQHGRLHCRASCLKHHPNRPEGRPNRRATVAGADQTLSISAPPLKQFGGISQKVSFLGSADASSASVIQHGTGFSLLDEAFQIKKNLSKILASRILRCVQRSHHERHWAGFEGDKKVNPRCEPYWRSIKNTQSRLGGVLTGPAYGSPFPASSVSNQRGPVNIPESPEPRFSASRAKRGI